MALLSIALIAVIALLSAAIGGVIVYFDSRRRNEDRGRLWTAITVAGFVFGVIPGVIVILSYFIVSRRF